MKSIQTNSTNLIVTLLFFLFSFAQVSFAQGTNKFEDNLQYYHEISLDLSATKESLKYAPERGTATENRSSQTFIDLAMPNGSTQEFRVIEAPILSKALSSQRPDFKSYLAQGIDDPTATARFNITPTGFYAVISGINGISYIEKMNQDLDSDSYVVYYDHAIITPEHSQFSCSMDDALSGMAEKESFDGSRDNSCFQYGSQLKNYDIVLTCSGEFYQLNGNSDAGAEAALLNRMTQVNSVYEPEVSVSFTIVEYLLNSNPATDPYVNPDDNSDANVTATDNHINDNVTVGSWDLGHGFHEFTCGGGCGWGGRAGLGVVCTASKGRGYTYLPNDIPANITVLLHEFGHMFSCRHTNYGCNTNNNCGRFEPGEGSSIMSTGAGCSNDDDFADRTDYFGIGSLIAIYDYTTSGLLLNNNASCNSSVVGGWSDCTNLTATGNNPPTSDANANSIDGLNIPNSTPFTLDGSGSDPDGNGSLTYSWEQYDTDYANSSLPDDAGNSTTGPQFRSFPPSTETERTLPQLTSVLAGNVTTGTGEVLPTVARTLTWRFTVRDNEMGGGGVACDEISINVTADGPFQITSQNGVTAWSAGDTETISWDVANTDDASYSCPNVDILYSSDGGTTFSTTLAAGVANDGSQDITVPAVATSTGRIKIICTGNSNIFFDINDTDIAIISGCPAEGGTIANSDAVSAPQGESELNLALFAGVEVNSVTGVLDAGDQNSNLAVEDDSGGTCIQLGNSPKYETFPFAVGANGNITFTRTGQGDYNSVLGLYQNAYDPNNECDNWLNSTGDFNGSTVFLSNSFTEMMSTGLNYVLLPSAFSSSTPPTGNYEITFSSPVYDTEATTPTGFLYTYIIVNDATGNIVAFDENTDLTNGSTFPTGSYTIHGLSYQNGEPIAGYIGGSFATFQSDLINGTICGDLSTNSVAVTIQAPLPVELISFTGKLRDKEVLLNWSTATEINNDYFLLEKSTDGRTFQKLGTIEGKGTTSIIQQYDYIDPRPSVGINYYRLTQVDYDGSSEVTGNIVAVIYNKEGAISVQPNPVVGDQLQLIYQTETRGTLGVEIYGATGKLVKRQLLETEADHNVFDLSLDGLSKGVYLIRTVQNGNVQTLRFVKGG